MLSSHTCMRGRVGAHKHVLCVFLCPRSRTWRLVALRGLSHFILLIEDGIGIDARRPAVREPLALTEDSRSAGDEERLRVCNTSPSPFLGECERLSHRSTAVPDRLSDALARPRRSTGLSMSSRSIKFWTTSASKLFDVRASFLKQRPASSPWPAPRAACSSCAAPLRSRVNGDCTSTFVTRESPTRRSASAPSSWRQASPLCLPFDSPSPGCGADVCGLAAAATGEFCTDSNCIAFLRTSSPRSCAEAGTLPSMLRLSGEARPRNGDGGPGQNFPRPRSASPAVKS